MSDQPQYPSYPTGPGDGSQPPSATVARPSQVDLAIKLVWGLVALSLVSTVATFFMLDTIVDQALEDPNVAGSVDADTIRAGAVVGAAIGLVITVGLYALLAFFLGRGANWARIVYSVLAALGVTISLFSLGNQPAVLLVLTVVQLGLTVGILYLLWQKESSAFFKAR